MMCRPPNHPHPPDCDCSYCQLLHEAHQLENTQPRGLQPYVQPQSPDAKRWPVRWGRPQLPRDTLTVVFTPKMDITAYELALVIANGGGRTLLVDAEHPIPDEVKRHYKEAR